MTNKPIPGDSALRKLADGRIASNPPTNDTDLGKYHAGMNVHICYPIRKRSSPTYPSSGHGTEHERMLVCQY